MRAIRALTIIGAISILSSVTAMAEQTPKQTPKQSPASPPHANQINSVRTQSDKSLTEFWTPERLRSARPMPTPSVDPDDVKK